MFTGRLGLAAVAVGLGGLLVLAGCGGDKGGPVGRVTGKVTFNGLPLEGALVEFQPEKGSSSSGLTDAAGRYELKFTFNRKGAAVGKHRVAITIEPGDDEGPAAKKKVVIPAKYNVQTTLSAEVKPGSNEINFDLKP